jgi:hypothetical protein
VRMKDVVRKTEQRAIMVGRAAYERTHGMLWIHNPLPQLAVMGLRH